MYVQTFTMHSHTNVVHTYAHISIHLLYKYKQYLSLKELLALPMAEQAHLTLLFKVKVQVERQAVKPNTSFGEAMLVLSQEVLQKGTRLMIPSLLLKVLNSVTQHTNIHLTG